MRQHISHDGMCVHARARVCVWLHRVWMYAHINVRRVHLHVNVHARACTRPGVPSQHILRPPRARALVRGFPCAPTQGRAAVMPRPRALAPSIVSVSANSSYTGSASNATLDPTSPRALLVTTLATHTLSHTHTHTHTHTHPSYLSHSKCPLPSHVIISLTIELYPITTDF